jgi:hypothetical protein
MRPELKAVSDSPLPDPPVPAGTKANGWRFELDMQRIRRSDTWVLCPPDMRPWLLMIWATAFEQDPAGSLPADRQLLSAHVGIEPRVLSANADILLRGFTLCSDGRLYHSVVVERVLALIGYREESRVRKEKYRASLKMSHGTDTGQTQDSHGTPPSVPQESHGRNATGTGTGTGTGTENKDVDPPNPQGDGYCSPLSGIGLSSLMSIRGALEQEEEEIPISGDVLPAGVDARAWVEFLAHRKEIRKPLTALAAKKNAEVLRKLSPGQQREAVDATIANRWTGVFPPKGAATRPGTVTPQEYREMIARGEV